MIKEFCDKCDKEVEPFYQDSEARMLLTVGRNNYAINIQHHPKDKNGDKLLIHLCRYCLIDIINMADDRPKAYNPHHEYDQMKRRIAEIVEDSKTTLDMGMRLKEYVDKHGEIFGGYQKPL